MEINREVYHHRLKQIAQRLFELSAWRYHEELQLSGEFRDDADETWQPIRPGDPWPTRSQKVHFRFQVVIPESWTGKPVNLCLWPEGESLLKVDGKAIGGLNPFHQEYRLCDSAEAGRRYEVAVESVPRLLFGEPVRNPHLAEACLAVPDLRLQSLFNDLFAIYDVALFTEKEKQVDLTYELIDVLNQSLSGLQLPRHDSKAYMASFTKSSHFSRSVSGFRLADRVQGTGEEAHDTASLWEEWEFPEAPSTLSVEFYDKLPKLRQTIRQSLERLKKRYPTNGRLWVSGHAHIDLAWLWPLAETENKIERTFATMLTLMEEFPDFHFNQSSAQLYEMIEERSPKLFEKIQERVAEGRWDVVGGMWVEPDCSMTSGESMTRQLLMGQRYFQSRFGKMATVAWLPDTFGFSGNLPQLFKQAGIPNFFTMKMNWNDTNALPADLFHWEGLDGSRVLAHCFFNRHNYNGRIEASDIGETWKNYQQKREHDQSLFSFGYGDGGGGPTAEMLTHFERLKDFPGMPKLEMGKVEDFYQEVESDDLPVWHGEQYFEFHRGIYTSQAKVKQLNRRLEHRLMEAEAACALAHQMLKKNYPQPELEKAWKILLRNQFHDILPGSSVKTVYEVANKELQRELDMATSLRDQALESLTERVKVDSASATEKIVIWNLSLSDRALDCQVDCPSVGQFRLESATGKSILFEKSGSVLNISDPELAVPSMGYLALSVVPESQQDQTPHLKATDHVLENEHVRVELGDDGTLHSFYDKLAKRELLADRGNQIWSYTDIPQQYEAWEVDRNYTDDGQEILAAEPLKLVEQGPVRSAIEVKRAIGNSRIVQRYCLSAHSAKLEIQTKVQWHGRRSFLRALLPLNLRSHEGWFETAFGAVPRSAQKNTSWEKAQFEVPAHRWADLSEGNYGVSLINDGKYGHSLEDNVLGLSLLRSPIYPDPLADEGEHEFRYAIFPHEGDWRTQTITEAESFNAPLSASVSAANGGDWPMEQSLLQVKNKALRLAALKKCEDSDDLLLRVYESHGTRGHIELETIFPLQSTEPVDVLERPLDHDGDSSAMAFTPFQVLSLKLKGTC